MIAEGTDKCKEDNSDFKTLLAAESAAKEILACDMIKILNDDECPLQEDTPKQRHEAGLV